MINLSEKAKIGTGLGLALTLIVIVSAMSYYNETHSVQSRKWVIHTHQVIEKLQEIISLIQDAETAQRGYLITGKRSYLQPYNLATGEIDPQIKQLRELVADNPVQLDSVKELEKLIALKFAELKQTISLRATTGADAAFELVQTDDGKRLMDQIRSLTGLIKDEEENLLIQREQTLERQVRDRRINLLTLDFLLAFFFLSGLFLAHRRLTHSRLEAVQREKDQQLELAVEGAEIGLWNCNVQTGDVIFNERWANIIEYSLSEIQPTFKFWESRVHPDDLPNALKTWNTHLEGGVDFFRCEHRLMTKSGAWKWIMDRGKVVQRDGYGKPLRMAGITLDINEYKQAEQSLRESRARTAVILDSVPQSIFWKDVNGLYMGCNRNFASATGLKNPDEIVGKTDYDLPWSREEADAYRADDHEVISENHPKRDIIEQVQQADGRRIWVSTTKIPLTNDSGEPYALMGVFEDITERKRLQEETTQLNTQLLSEISAHKQAQLKLEKSNRGLLLLSTCNELVAKASTEAYLLQEVCNLVVTVGGHSMAWIGMAANDEARSVIPVAHAGFQTEYLQNLNISWKDCELGRGPTGTAIRTGKASIMRHIRTCPEYAPWCENASQYGYESSIALPLTVFGTTVGALNIYSGHEDAFDQDEVALLMKVADNLAFGIVSARTLEEKQIAERDLIKSEALYEDLVETSQDLIWKCDPEGRYLYLNRAWEGVLGYTLDEMLGRTFSEFQDPQAGSRFVSMFDKLVNDRMVKGFETTCVNKWGKEVDLVFNAKIVTDEQGLISGIQGTAYDITAQKKSETALRESEEKFSKAFENSPDAMTITSVVDGTLVDVNRTFTILSGYSREECIGHTSIELGLWANPFDRERYVAELRNKGRVIDYDADFRSKTGQRRRCSVSGEFIDIGGELYILGVIQDNTERKEAEELIIKLNESLEQRVRDRTAELEQANTDLESFSYSVSHDLRAPLRAISGFAEIIARRHRDHLNEEGQRYFANIVEASEQMDRLIDDLLRYSRLGRRVIRLHAINPLQAIERAVKTLSERIIESGAELAVPEDMPPVHGDLTLLEQIFTNLLENALTYSSTGKIPRIEISSIVTDGHVVIEVSDNGIGITPAYHQKIFNMFQRLHSQEDYPGTGIGLAIVKKSCNLMDGHVWVESDEGHGSRFFIKLAHASAP